MTACAQALNNLSVDCSLEVTKMLRCDFSSRWEMRKDEKLEEEEKAILEHLKLMCTIQDSSASDKTEEQ